MCRPIVPLLMLAAVSAAHVTAAEIRVQRTPADPYGAPRPAPGQQHVPLRTSFYIDLAAVGDKIDDDVLPETVTIELQPAGQQAATLLGQGQKFADGFHGWLRGGADRKGERKLLIYIDGDQALAASTKYTIHVSARTRGGAELATQAGTWDFTTEAAPAVQPIEFSLALDQPTVHWQGGFFTGICGTSFATNYHNRLPTFELMDAVRQTSPKAWGMQRDFWLTGFEHQPQFLAPNLPNIVRERETRRITKMDLQENGVVLHIEDFFGHEQYGIKADRPLSGDYRAGDEVLIADGVHDARAKVVRADDDARSVLVTKFDTPDGGWKLDYTGSLPTREDPQAPGLFPPGGTYLRKFAPCGTPTYYWGRMDSEFDLVHRQFRRRLIVNFTDAPGDLAIDGRNWTTAKDYAELQDVTRTITGHIIDRYGAVSLDFVWSIFNEPDLGAAFWRTDWNELQKFYDYSVDGILRAFEDRGYDSSRVYVGGLELGGIFGVNLRLTEFLAHCSPTAEAQGALRLNAAFADSRLDGKRSKRVEDLCQAHGGKGAPCDFISIHAYNRAQLMADKLARAKEMALEIDADYYARLAIHSHESCPGWVHLPDPAYGDSYLGNGFFETWCADVARRQLQRAAADPRYAAGETILTFWPWPNNNFDGGNDAVRQIRVDDNGDGVEERTVTVAMPILNFLGLLSQMGDDYRALPEVTQGGHVLSGFAAQAGDTVRLLLYSHNTLDTESRSTAEFDVALNLSGLSGKEATVREYQFDKHHNSYFYPGRALRDGSDGAGEPATAAQAGELQQALAELDRDEVSRQLTGLDRLAALGRVARSASGRIYELHEASRDDIVRNAASTTIQRINAPRAYPAEAVQEVQELSKLRETGTARLSIDADGRAQLKLRVAGNGANFVVIERSMAR